MKRWDRNNSCYVEEPRVDAFLADLVAVSRKHGMTLAHEDSQGAFLVCLWDSEDHDHLLHAHISDS